MPCYPIDDFLCWQYVMILVGEYDVEEEEPDE